MLKKKENVLYLVPVPIAEIDINWSLPLDVIKQIVNIQCFIVENAKTARHYLKQLNPEVKYDEITLFELDKHHLSSQLVEIRALFKQHETIGLMSEAGLPCIADPGNHVVRIAHEMHVRVRPLTGPSSILLALIASGLNGQQFKFNGYLPVKPEDRQPAILKIEKDARQATQLFIEAPYRNEKLLADLVRLLQPSMRLLVAVNLTAEDEKIICQPVSWWKSHKPELGKVPCLFGLGI
jgi:16S rRNA (cytidine1402-2'-O)-methyltransferase